MLGCPYRLRSPRNENVADGLQYDFASLITQTDLVAHDAPIWLRLRLPFLQSGHFKIEFVSWAYRIRQPQLVPAHSGKDIGSRLELGRKRDEDCKRVSARCGQSSKD